MLVTGRAETSDGVAKLLQRVNFIPPFTGGFLLKHGVATMVGISVKHCVASGRNSLIFRVEYMPFYVDEGLLSR